MNFSDSLYAEYTNIIELEKCAFYARILKHKDGREVIDLECKSGSRKEKISLRAGTIPKDLLEIRNHGFLLNDKALSEIRKAILDKYGNLPVKRVEDGIGFEFDEANEPVCFKAGMEVHRNGNVYRVDPADEIPAAEGKINCELLNSYFSNVKRQLAALHSCMAPLAAVMKKLDGTTALPILLIYGDSSSGKTTCASLAQSLMVSPAFSRAGLDFNGTDKSLVYCLRNNHGIPVLIDDTSLCEDGKKYRSLIYSLANGKDRGRLMGSSGKGVYREERGEGGTTITITSEENLIYAMPADYKGVVARLFPMKVTGTDLFDSNVQVLKMKRYMMKNHGKVGIEIASYILQHYKEVIEDLYSCMEKIAESHQKEDGIIQRWGWYFAGLKVTAEILERIGLEFQVDDIISYMVGQIKKTMEIQNSCTTDYLVKNILYPMLVQDAEPSKDGKVLYVPSSKFKTAIHRFMSENKVKMTQRLLKEKMCDMGLLLETGVGQFDKNIYQINGKGYTLALPDTVDGDGSAA